MKPLDDELKTALRRVEPPDGYTERVLAEARRGAASKPGFAERWRAVFPQHTVRWAAGLALAFFLVIFAAARYRQHEQARIQGERAGAEARLALQIASAKLNAVLKVAAQPVRRDFEN